MTKLLNCSTPVIANPASDFYTRRDEAIYPIESAGGVILPSGFPIGILRIADGLKIIVHIPNLATFGIVD